MADKEVMIRQILDTVRSDHGLWPADYSKNESENYLTIIEELMSPSLNSRGAPISEEDFQKAKVWAQRVMETYIQKNPFQGAFVRPFAVSMFETIDKIWLKRSAEKKDGSWL